MKEKIIKNTEWIGENLEKIVEIVQAMHDDIDERNDNHNLEEIERIALYLKGSYFTLYNQENETN